MRRFKRSEMLAALEAGESKASIARRMGLSQQRIYQILHPEKERARAAVARALKEGKLVRPDCCSRCGEFWRSRLRRPAAHHEDYSRPLDVIWVCYDCHGGIHAARRHKPIDLTAPPSDIVADGSFMSPREFVEIRNGLGLSRAAFAEELCTTEGMVWKMEFGECGIKKYVAVDVRALAARLAS